MTQEVRSAAFLDLIKDTRDSLKRIDETTPDRGSREHQKVVETKSMTIISIAAVKAFDILNS